MTITVFGLGFVGLTTALGFAHLGNTVYGVEISDGRRSMLARGELPFQEPGMEEELRLQLGTNLFLCADAKEAVPQSEFVFYCVGTPCGENGQADLSALFHAIDATIDAAEKDDKVLVTKSTVPPSTTEKRVVPYVTKMAHSGQKFHLANNPEFLREGHCWDDFLHADRIVIGSSDPYARERLTALYQPMGLPLLCVSPSTGEFIKYLSNTLLATMISYSNEMAEIAEQIGGIETAKAFRTLHMDKRWGNCSMTSYVYPGCGYGGYCLPKDTKAMAAKAREAGTEASILNAVIQTNEERPAKVAARIADSCTANDCIGILGLSFKPDSDDVRESPARMIIQELRRLGCKNIVAYDPVATEEFQRAYPELEIETCESLDEICHTAGTLAIVTAWPEFQVLGQIEGKRIVDCRYMLL